ncbi:MAG: hypothetical protein IJP18_04300 [Oscillospiraceae bacterium]|nr:hypothetical protein [Oscillospiraceae bacterium]
MDEKILTLLTEIKSDISGIKSEISDIKTEMTDMKSETRGLKLHLENVTDSNINLLAENVSSANTRLISIEKDVTALKDNQEIADVLIELGTAFKR